MNTTDDLQARIRDLSPERRALLQQRASAAGVTVPDSLGASARQPVNQAKCAGAPVPVEISAPSPGTDLADWLADSHSQVSQSFDDHGALLFRGFDVGGAPGLEKAINAFSGPAMDYPGNIQSVIRRSPAGGHVATSTEYSEDLELRLHSECAFANAWPLHIWFLAETVARRGGATPIMDNRGIYRRIDPDVRNEFERRGVMYLRNFGFGSSRSWQEIFGTSDRSAVEARCRAEGITVEWLGEHELRTRSVRPAILDHVVTGERLWFNHANSTHVTANPPDLLDAFRQNFAPDELPRHCFFGDGGQIDDSQMAAVRQACDAETVRFEWQPGDVMLLDNMRYGHGRDRFSGERRVLVGMAVEVRRIGDEVLATDIALTAS